MSCSWIVLVLAGVGALSLACLLALTAVAIGLRCYGAGLIDKFLDSEVDGRWNLDAEALQAKVLTKDEARRIAVNIARLPGLFGKPD